MSIKKHGLTGAEEKVARQMHTSARVSLRTTAPYRIEPEIRVEKIGFADIPVLLQYFDVKFETKSEAIPELRRRVFAYLQVHQICDEAVEFVPVVGVVRRRMFVDENPDSLTCGKRKKGVLCRGWFEIRQGWVDQFHWNGRYGTPNRASRENGA